MSALSPRQTEIIKALAAGNVVKEIADKVGSKPGTVRAHMRIIYAKLDARTQAHAVALWIKKRKAALSSGS
jgi:DNA-binding CsgD family transcriptional regulator